MIKQQENEFILYITYCPEVGQIPGPADSVVSDVNKDLDNFSSFCSAITSVGKASNSCASLFLVAGYSPSFHLIGLSEVICLP